MLLTSAQSLYAVAVLMNFSGNPVGPYRVGLPFAGTWEELINTDATEFGGSGVGNFGAVTPEKRRAHFVSALSLALPGGRTKTYVGRVDGTLVWPPRGDKGFGYDPMFVPAGYEQTFGEMDPAEKHEISHRADAFRKLVKALK